MELHMVYQILALNVKPKWLNNIYYLIFSFANYKKLILCNVLLYYITQLLSMAPKKPRQRKIQKSLPLNNNILSEISELQKDLNANNQIIFSETLDNLHIIENSVIKDTVIQEQDDDYELSVIIDIIKMQENDEAEKREKERQQQAERYKMIEELIIQRDHNIKEVLRKLKVLTNKQSSFENELIHILENAMTTQELYITINNIDFYDNIQCYLGLNSNRGTIRLSDEVKEYLKKMFIIETIT